MLHRIDELVHCHPVNHANGTITPDLLRPCEVIDDSLTRPRVNPLRSTLEGVVNTLIQCFKLFVRHKEFVSWCLQVVDLWLSVEVFVYDDLSYPYT